MVKLKLAAEHDGKPFLLKDKLFILCGQNIEFYSLESHCTGLHCKVGTA